MAGKIMSQEPNLDPDHCRGNTLAISGFLVPGQSSYCGNMAKVNNVLYVYVYISISVLINKHTAWLYVFYTSVEHMIDCKEHLLQETAGPCQFQLY